MAKEMMIVFVYDTQACQKEDDDPADAVLYFHPGWVSDTQRHALAGQVVGTAHCVKSLFSLPTSITLQSGKFIIREYGRYILAIGSDRNIPDWVLNNRASLLTSMIKVYHCDLETMASQFPERQRFAEKLYQMFETYLPVLQYGSHIFQRVPILTLPKSATSVYLEAMHVLDVCARIKGVLGGVLLYNNKIIASQLPPALTSYLTVVDPYRYASAGEPLRTDCVLPLGSQLLAVYVHRDTVAQLANSSQVLNRAAFEGEDLVNDVKKKQEAEKDKFPPTGMKRDKSLLFTAVPEEDNTMLSPPSPDLSRKQSNIPDVVPFTNRARPRPNKLSLSFKTQPSLEEDVKENNDVVFTGQTSVCSTPMVEFKRLHGNVLSIVQNPTTNQKEHKQNGTEPDILKTIDNNAHVIIEKEKRDHKMVIDINTIGNHYVNKPEPIRKLASINDIQDTFKRFSDRATAKFKFKRKQKTEENSTKTVTINDPSFPVFRNDGVAISESLFQQYLEQHYAAMREETTQDDNMFNFNKTIEEKDNFNKIIEEEDEVTQFVGFDSDMQKSPQKTPKKLPKDLKTVDQSRRKSLSLPLKSLSDSSENNDEGFRKKLTGVQLTPLMEKLSHLAFSDKSSGYSSRVMTPLELRDFTSTPAAEKVGFSEKTKHQKLTSQSSADSDDNLEALTDYSSTSVKCGLFVSGLHSVSILVLLDLPTVDLASAEYALWELTLNSLGSIEQKCSEPFPSASDSSEYSYLVWDRGWGCVKKGGEWRPPDIATMGLIHCDLMKSDHVCAEAILRSEESAVVCRRRGDSSVYYCERAARPAGVPAPHDALAAAHSRAAAALQRDHALHLL